MNKITTISKMVIKNAIRNKFLYFFLFVSIVLIFLTVFLSFFNLGAQVKILIDISLTISLFFGFFISVFLSASDLYEDQNNRVLYTILTKNVSRLQYIFGKFLGYAVIEFFVFAALFIEINLLIYLLQEAFSVSAAMAVFYIYIEMLVITAVSILFSLFFPAAISISLSLLVFFAGHAKLSFIFQLNLESKISQYIVNFIFAFVPNLEVFNFRLAAANKIAIPFTYYISSLFYGLTYAYAILLIAVLFFYKKDIK